ncbi:hypothetical protein HMPREF1624_00764 [Sporothrix schenckii ATCC 58251]|uniref:Dehydrogenase FUB6 n=1 Tax=Sporothrix schenckii (strain ATCC 58251 / de Perez 2211183) TaxID=1391915 RepID=U7Q639_SPOS1|nr:hypothetical protein HMPREF1624_00764 [Sporothrix schenckii ATCC 58251]
MVANKTLIYKRIPTGAPVAGQDLVVEDRPFDLDAPPPAGGVVVEVLWVSYDPYLRGKLRDPSIPSYSPAFELGSPITNDGVARVIKSDDPKLPEGTLVLAYMPIAQYVALPADVPTNRGLPGVRPVDNPFGLDLGHFLGPLGMPGLTAYSGLYEITKPKKGETLFVSSAAGAVGQMVGQIAKRLGLRVIGSVGSDEKLDFVVRALGYDAGFNYKKEAPADAVKRLAPDGIDIYFDNVGGDHMEAALQNIKVHGRVVVCGTISDYNKPQGQKGGIKDMFRFVQKRILVQGMLVGDANFGPMYAAEHQKNVQQWLHEGSFKSKLSVTEGIDNAADGFVGMLEGKNFGKAVLKIKD